MYYFIAPACRIYIYIKPLLAHKEKLFPEINMQQEKNTIQLNDADKATITKKKIVEANVYKMCCLAENY